MEWSAPLRHCVPSTPLPAARQAANRAAALTWRPSILAPFSLELYAHSSQGPFRESLQVCLVKLSHGNSLPLLRRRDGAGTVPFYTVLRARGTRRPRTYQRHRSRRLCCISCCGPPTDLGGNIRMLAAWTQTLLTQAPLKFRGFSVSLLSLFHLVSLKKKKC